MKRPHRQDLIHLYVEDVNPALVDIARADLLRELD